MTEITRADIDRTVAGRTVARRFLDTVREHGEETALRWKEGDDWAEWTFDDYGEQVARVAAGLRAQGVQRGDRIVLMLRNRPEFHVLDIAALVLGAVPISIYNSSAPEQVAYLVGHCEARLAVVEDQAFLDRFAEARHELPELRAIGAIEPVDGGIDFAYEELAGTDPLDAAEPAALGTPEDLATVIYTSGTTGPPKGVMLSNYNVCWTAESLRLALPFDDYRGKRLVSYLPMAHIAERMTSHYQQAMLGYSVSSCPEAGEVAAYAREVKPNIMFGVPRVWEKFAAGVSAAIHADPEKGKQFDDAVAAAEPIALRRSWGEATEEDEKTWAFLDDVAFRGVRELLGLDQLDAAITGAAPIPPSLLSWYRAIGVPLSEIYGMSENTGPLAWTAERIKPGTVGVAMPGTEVALASDGEVICRGGHVFVGYLNDPQKTAETVDPEGWLHTGDIGEVDDDGYLRIVDRKKELLITAGGKNVSPANLEAALKTVPLIGQACAVGDRQPFVAALVVLDVDTAPAWAKQEGIEFTSLADLARHPDVIAEIQRGVDEAMHEFSNAERVKKVHVLADEWLPDSDLLTPTSKLKRRGIHARFEAEIAALYG